MADTQLLGNVPKHLLESLPALPTDLFPLPLTSFEKYLIWDETQQQPMNSFIELHFLDPLQVDVMEHSIAAAMYVHPLLVSIVKREGERLWWEHQPDFHHQLRIESNDPPLQNSWPVPIDLLREPGIKFWYREQADGRSRILIQLHHATTDGVGLRRFLIDAMTIYAHATAPESVDPSLRAPWNKVDPALLQRRADFSDSFGGPATQPLSTWQRIKNARYFHFQLPQPLATHSFSKASGYSDAQTKAGNEPLEHLVIDRGTSQCILEKSRETEIGINELSLALLFETCKKWNQQHGRVKGSDRLRVLMPYDLRSRIDLRMPATNRLSFSFIGRTVADCGNVNALARSIGREVQSMKSSQLPLDFLAALDGAAKHPRLMRWAIARSRRMATAVLTYAGDISRGMQKYFPENDGARIVGDARLDRILAAPPVRENTHWSLGLCINWGELCISAAWNRHAISRSDCVSLLDIYKQQWLDWLE